MKNICIIRNASFSQNAMMHRIVTALVDISNLIVVSRERDRLNKQYECKKVNFQNNTIENYSLNIRSDYGKGINNLIPLLLYQFQLFKVLYKTRKKFDVIHAIDFDSGLVACLFCMLFKKKYVYHIADFYIESRQGIPTVVKKVIKALDFFVIKKAEVTILCTENRREQIKGSSPNKIEIIHNVPTIDKEASQNIIAEKNSELTLCYIGTLGETRFLKEMIEAVSRRPNDLKLIVGGYGKLEDYIKDKSLKYENIQFIGKVNYLDTFDFYSSSDIMVAVYDPRIKNHKYSAPNKFYESILLKKPIIVGKDTGIDELVREHDIGFIIDYDYKEFINTLDEIKSTPAILEQKRENIDKISSLYSWEKMKGKIREVYKLIK
ncbi:glycosyltransferase [Siminovitchia terrae]|uniref:Glycosyltransferase n=1 Tax=Siminovitchia terrae TaxID=1914933 RepID=A0A429X7T3_SIMTE|nr:glycosyltransferase [Siminovitchia terrae]RST59498.1 glycosyltransferase [Siminovitchia terrae]